MCCILPLVGLLLLNNTSGFTSDIVAAARMFGLRSLAPSKPDIISLDVGFRSLADIPNDPELFLLNIAAEG